MDMHAAEIADIITTIAVIMLASPPHTTRHWKGVRAHTCMCKNSVHVHTNFTCQLVLVVHWSWFIFGEN